MKKSKIIATLLAMSLAFSMVGCGASSDDEVITESSATNTSSESTTVTEAVELTQDVADEKAESSYTLSSGWAIVYFSETAFGTDDDGNTIVVASDNDSITPNEGWYTADMTAEYDTSVITNSSDDDLLELFMDYESYVTTMACMYNYMAELLVESSPNDYDTDTYNEYISYNTGGYMAAYFNGTSLMPVCVYWSDDAQLLALVENGTIGTDGVEADFLVGASYGDEIVLSYYTAENLLAYYTEELISDLEESDEIEELEELDSSDDIEVLEDDDVSIDSDEITLEEDELN